MNSRNRVKLYVGVALIVAASVAACAPAAAPAPASITAPTTMAMPESTMSPMEPMAPSNGNRTPGPAITENLTGDPVNGSKVFVDNCQKCHGENGVGGVENPGSDDGTIPPLNPVDEDMGNNDPKLFATTLDLFIEHGSTPEGDSPKEKMPAWGDDQKLTPQQIADVVAYIISLNKQ
jgi:mono/diheme cytochrome c family protein